MPTKTPKFFIKTQYDKPHSFIRRHWLWATLILMAIAAYFIGRYSNIDVLNAFRGQKQTWSDINQSLSQESQQQKKTISLLTTELKIKDNALLELNNSLNQLNQEKNQLKADVAFYENLLSHKDTISTLRVFEASAQPIDDYIVLKLVLAQKLEKALTKTGTLTLTLTGIENDKAKSLDLIKQFALDDTFAFKYFQIKNYAITLPEGFIPTSLLVELHSKDNRPTKVTERIAWQDVWQKPQITNNAESSDTNNPQPTSN